MKQLVAIGWMILAGLSIFSSCSECKVCTKENETRIRICNLDANGKRQYNQTVTDQEALGYACKDNTGL